MQVLLKLIFLRRLYDMTNQQSLGHNAVRKDGANILVENIVQYCPPECTLED